MAGLSFFWVAWDENLESWALLCVCQLWPEEGHPHAKAALREWGSAHPCLTQALSQRRHPKFFLSAYF